MVAVVSRGGNLKTMQPIRKDEHGIVDESDDCDPNLRTAVENDELTKESCNNKISNTVPSSEEYESENNESISKTDSICNITESFGSGKKSRSISLCNTSTGGAIFPSSTSNDTQGTDSVSKAQRENKTECNGKSNRSKRVSIVDVPNYGESANPKPKLYYPFPKRHGLRKSRVCMQLGMYSQPDQDSATEANESNVDYSETTSGITEITPSHLNQCLHRQYMAQIKVNRN